ncbi:glycosyltransferase family 8 protein [Celeribacter sp. ULVN23_4]
MLFFFQNISVAPMSSAHFSYVFDQGYAFPTLVSLASLLRTTQSDCEILLLTDRAMPHFRAALDQLMQLHPKASVSLVENPDLPSEPPAWAAGARIKIFWQLRLYPLLQRKSLVIDGDTLVMDDAARAYDIPLGCHAIAAAPDYYYRHLFYKRRHYSRFRPFQARKLKRKARRIVKDATKQIQASKRDIPLAGYTNTGVVLIDMPKLRAQGKADRLCDFDSCLRTHEEKGWGHQDQDWLNFLFASDLAEMHIRWNVQHTQIVEENTQKPYVPSKQRQGYREALDNPGILHFAGDQKPWHAPEDTRSMTDFQRQAHMHWRKEAAQLSDETGMDILRLCNDPFAT